MSIVKKDRTFYDATGGGVTFSGGECMLQINFLEQVLRLCRENGIHAAVDTAGHVPFDHFERILPYTDLLLYDVKCMNPEKHARYTGVDNKKILENLKRLLAASVSVWVRIPVVPGVNDSEEEMIAIRGWFEQHGWPERIEVLPYHAMGEHKYGALGFSSPVFSVPDAEKMKELRAIFNR